MRKRPARVRSGAIKMAGRKNFINHVAPTVPFHFPEIMASRPRVGKQPYAPGESQLDFGGPNFRLMPWPNKVPSILGQMLANFPGRPQAPALAIVNNAATTLPENYLFIAGIASKSKG